MTASVITISALVGTGGAAIARSVAETMSYRYYDWEITSQAAALAGVSPEVVAAAERVPGFLERVLNRLLAASAVTGDESQAILGPDPAVVTSAVQSLSSANYRDFIERVVQELAGHGEAVIVGHAAQVTLKDRSDVLKVLVRGSVGPRAERLVEEQDISRDEAIKSVHDSDKQRTRLFKVSYGVDWLDASGYDLALSTDSIPPAVAAEIILMAAKSVPQ